MKALTVFLLILSLSVTQESGLRMVGTDINKNLKYDEEMNIVAEWRYEDVKPVKCIMYWYVSDTTNVGGHPWYDDYDGNNQLYDAVLWEEVNLRGKYRVKRTFSYNDLHVPSQWEEAHKTFWIILMFEVTLENGYAELFGIHIPIKVRYEFAEGVTTPFETPETTSKAIYTRRQIKIPTIITENRGIFYLIGIIIIGYVGYIIFDQKRRI